MALSRQNAGVRCFGIAEAAYAPVRAPCDVHASRRQLVATVERDQQAGQRFGRSGVCEWTGVPRGETDFLAQRDDLIGSRRIVGQTSTSQSIASSMLARW